MNTGARILIAIAIGIISGLLCGFYQASSGRGAGDIGMPLCMGQALFDRVDPYTTCRGFHSDGQSVNNANPLTTALITLPLLPLPRTVAAGVFFGLVSALLSWVLTREGQLWRLLVFMAFPYWQALQTVQWSPLLLAVYFCPALLALTLAKPHVAVAVALSVPWRRWPVIMGVALVALSLLLMPDWPLHMLGRVGTPEAFVPPVAIFPGMLLLLAALRWRDRRARYLLLLSLVPQRLFYDLLLLFAIPRERRSLLLLVILSWLLYAVWFFIPIRSIPWHILLLYLPALAIVLLETRGTVRGPARPEPS